MRMLLLLALFSRALSAQPVSFGAKVGVPLTDVLETRGIKHDCCARNYFADNAPYLAGATIQFNFPAAFSLELDGLYRRVSYLLSTQISNSIQFRYTQNTANSWEFPLLGKYTVRPGPLRPFVDAGPNFRLITSAVRTGPLRDDPPSAVPELVKKVITGVTIGGGVELKVTKLRIAPEIRYTWWTSRNFNDPVSSLLTTNRNQVDLIVGLRL